MNLIYLETVHTFGGWGVHFLAATWIPRRPFSSTPMHWSKAHQDLIHQPWFWFFFEGLYHSVGYCGIRQDLDLECGDLFSGQTSLFLRFFLATSKDHGISPLLKLLPDGPMVPIAAVGRSFAPRHSMYDIFTEKIGVCSRGRSRYIFQSYGVFGCSTVAPVGGFSAMSQSMSHGCLVEQCTFNLLGPGLSRCLLEIIQSY